uniref:Uncharacterized protein n=1 Tax=Lactuca sativa TaxID=4236 RepID=A0A9R1XX00_LACSA|nr:hypothetical protein LSAT_V11C100024940 [Lactuca sativa]
MVKSGIESGNRIEVFEHDELRMVAEAPFRPREQLLEKQRLFQSIHKHTHLKSPMDKLTSVAIPVALAGSCLFLIWLAFVYRVECPKTEIVLVWICLENTTIKLRTSLEYVEILHASLIS